MNRVTQVKATILTPVEALIISAVLAAVEAVQLNITMSPQAHAFLSVAITVLVGVGVKVLSPAQILSKMPVEVVTIISALLGGVLVLQQAFSMSSVWHTVIGVVVVVAAALGIRPSEVPTTTTAP